MMLNGVSVFSQTAGGTDCPDAVLEESPTFNICGGHATAGGQYHYHLAPACLLYQLRDHGTVNQYNRHSPLIGWAYDGFPIYGPHGSDGEYIYRCDHANANPADCLDSCNGHRQHLIDGFKYHYHITGPIGNLQGNITTAQLFPVPDTAMTPYTIGCFRGIVTEKWKSTFRNFDCAESGTVDGFVPTALNGVSHIIYPEQLPLSAINEPVTSPIEVQTEDPTPSPTNDPTHSSIATTEYYSTTATQAPTPNVSNEPTLFPSEHPSVTQHAATLAPAHSNQDTVISNGSANGFSDMDLSNPIIMAVVVGVSTIGLIVCSIVLLYCYKFYRENRIVDVNEQVSEVLTPLSSPKGGTETVREFPNTLQAPETPMTPLSPENHTTDFSKQDETGVNSLQMYNISNTRDRAFKDMMGL